MGDEDKGSHRNGYRLGHIHTAEGRVKIAIAEVRGTDDPFCPQALAGVWACTEELERLVVELYGRGLFSRDTEDAFRDPEMGRCAPSAARR